MQARLEYKYLVPIDLLDRIRTEIAPFVTLDVHSRKREGQEYTVRSVYLDTRRLSCYHEKKDGLKVRAKYRIRRYNALETDSLIYLEVKRKYINFIEKNRAPLRWDLLDCLIDGAGIESRVISAGGDQHEREDARRFFYNYHRRHLQPIILIVYEREAFQGRFDHSLRLTFDKNLRSALCPSFEQLFADPVLKPAMRQNFVLEVKFYGGLPAWLRALVTRYSLQRMALSKYTICLDSHHRPLVTAPAFATIAATTAPSIRRLQLKVKHA